MILKRYINHTNILTLFLIIIFYIFGFQLSKFIDAYFIVYKIKDYNKSSHKYLLFEIILEFSIALIIYKLFEYNHLYLLNPLYQNKQPPEYIYMFITIAFSFGIYNQLHEMRDKSKFLYEKYKNIMDEKYNHNKIYQYIKRLIYL